MTLTVCAANASLRRVRQQRRKWPAASYREQMVICHAMCTLHTCTKGARTVANLRNRHDRGSTLRCADLKRWVDAPSQKHETKRCSWLQGNVLRDVRKIPRRCTDQFKRYSNERFANDMRVQYVRTGGSRSDPHRCPSTHANRGGGSLSASGSVRTSGPVAGGVGGGAVAPDCETRYAWSCSAAIDAVDCSGCHEQGCRSRSAGSSQQAGTRARRATNGYGHPATRRLLEFAIYAVASRGAGAWPPSNSKSNDSSAAYTAAAPPGQAARCTRWSARARDKCGRRARARA